MTKRISTTEVAKVRGILVEKQGFVCASCGKKLTARDVPVLDPDHTTGYIRGVLHASCNGAEGKMKVKAMRGHKGVSPEELMIGLGKYLDFHKTPKTQLIHPSHLTDDEKRLQRNKKARVARARKKLSQ